MVAASITDMFDNYQNPPFSRNVSSIFKTRSTMDNIVKNRTAVFGPSWKFENAFPRDSALQRLVKSQDRWQQKLFPTNVISSKTINQMERSFNLFSKVDIHHSAFNSKLSVIAKPQIIDSSFSVIVHHSSDLKKLHSVGIYSEKEMRMAGIYFGKETLTASGVARKNLNDYGIYSVKMYKKSFINSLNKFVLESESNFDRLHHFEDMLSAVGHIKKEPEWCFQECDVNIPKIFLPDDALLEDENSDETSLVISSTNYSQAIIFLCLMILYLGLNDYVPDYVSHIIDAIGFSLTFKDPTVYLIDKLGD